MKWLWKQNRASLSSKSTQTKGCSARTLRMEFLESREMLAVTAMEFSAIRAAYPDLGITANMTDYNVIDVANLTAQNLQSAISSAASSAKSDLVVLRTSGSSNTITLSGTELSINNINVNNFGSVIIVALGSGNVTLNANQQSRVLSIQNSTVALGGITLTGGYLYTTNGGNGGGVYSYKSNLTMSQCVVTDNSNVMNSPNPAGGAYGGGIGAKGGGTLKLYDSVVSGNLATATAQTYIAAQGGGIHADVTELEMYRCSVNDNSAIQTATTPNAGQAWAAGGGIHASGNTTLNSCIVTNNIASGLTGLRGGGGGIRSYGVLTITNTLVADNLYKAIKDSGGYSSGGGGGILCDTLYATNSTIANNTVEFLDNAPYGMLQGGGICGGGYPYWGPKIVLNNTIIANNVSIIQGTEIPNNIVSNFTSQGSSAYVFYAQIEGYNNLIEQGDIRGIVHGVDGNKIGTANNPIDPKFVNPSGGNYRLQSSSPAVNAGNNTKAVDHYDNALLKDLDGNARIYGGTVDIGAYEYGSSSPAPLAIWSELFEQDRRGKEMVEIDYTDSIFNIDSEESLIDIETSLATQAVSKPLKFQPNLRMAALLAFLDE